MYYGGYFGTIAGSMNVAHPYWQQYLPKPKSRYVKYLDELSCKYREAANRVNWVIRYRAKREDIRELSKYEEKLREVADYYYDRATEALPD